MYAVQASQMIVLSCVLFPGLQSIEDGTHSTCMINSVSGIHSENLVLPSSDSAKSCSIFSNHDT